MKVLLALALVAAVQTRTCAAQSSLRLDPVDKPSTDRQHHQAETGCAGADTLLHPGGTAQLRHLTAEEAAETAIHEAVHRRQLQANCDSVMQVWDTNFVARVDAEAEAFCAGMAAGNVPLAWRRPRVVRAAAWWARFTTVGYTQALASFEHWCAPNPARDR